MTEPSSGIAEHQMGFGGHGGRLHANARKTAVMVQSRA
jgi:hypothetical protein